MIYYNDFLSILLNEIVLLSYLIMIYFLSS